MSHSLSTEFLLVVGVTWILWGLWRAFVRWRSPVFVSLFLRDGDEWLAVVKIGGMVRFVRGERDHWNWAPFGLRVLDRHVLRELHIAEANCTRKINGLRV